jgi:hypothetical protein
VHVALYRFGSDQHISRIFLTNYCFSEADLSPYCRHILKSTRDCFMSNKKAIFDAFGSVKCYAMWHEMKSSKWNVAIWALWYFISFQIYLSVSCTNTWIKSVVFWVYSVQLVCVCRISIKSLHPTHGVQNNAQNHRQMNSVSSSFA